MRKSTAQKLRRQALEIVCMAVRVTQSVAQGEARSQSATTKQRIAWATLGVLAHVIEDQVGKLYEQTSKGCSLIVPLEQWKEAMMACDFVAHEGGANSVCVLLHGPPGTGKSMFGSLAQQRAFYNKERWDPCNQAQVFSASRVVIIADEIDRMSEAQLTRLQNFIDDRRSSVLAKTIIVLTTNNYDVVKDHPLCRRSRVDVTTACSKLTENDRAKICQAWDTDLLEGDTVAELVANCRDQAVHSFISETSAQTKGENLLHKYVGSILTKGLSQWN